ncbi:beta-lactamase family protein [Granulosicoccus sp.]|nr:beta-lactamase family protein [Granulosicoccus sp.]
MSAFALTACLTTMELCMDIKKIISYLEECKKQINPEKEPGFCTGIVKNGETIHTINHGLSSIEHDSPLTGDSLFYLASESKQFTAACILKLVFEKKIRLSQDVRALVKEVEQFSEKITIQNLLNHTSGIADYFQYIYCQLNRHHSDYFDNKHILEIISSIEELDFTPNEKREYSNSNYILLSEIVKVCTGKPISKFASDNIFKPVGMKNTIFDDDRFKVVKNRVSGYISGAGTSQKYRVDLKNSCTVGDGGVLSSVNDLIKWEANYHSNQLLDRPVINGLTKRHKLKNGQQPLYANGLEHSPPEAPIPYVFHLGGFEGFSTFILKVPSEKFSLIYLSNSDLTDFKLGTSRSKKFELIS